MTTPDAMSDGLAAALIQISAHAERISSLDAREAGHFEQIAARLRDLASEVTTGQSRQDTILASLDDLDAAVAKLATHLADLAAPGENDDDTDRYQPVPPPRWWRLSGPEREAALDRLRAWVEQIYRPGYGQLAATLPPCWERHPVCLYTLDWLSELWSLLYLASQRDGPILAAQAEWHTRLLPAAADQMSHEASGCDHASGRRHYLPGISPSPPPEPACP
jgi:hypothetical protein